MMRGYTSTRHADWLTPPPSGPAPGVEQRHMFTDAELWARDERIIRATFDLCAGRGSLLLTSDFDTIIAEADQ